MEIGKLIRLAKEIKKRRPKTLRQNILRPRIRNRASWRKPSGLHSKQKIRIFGKSARPNVGWRVPAEVRGLINGYKPILISNLKDLEKIKLPNEAAIIAHIGKRNREKILKAAKEKGIRVLNYKNA